jgi:predicted O-linked N-acetylglucosamine transferase (SPINDLY family)
MPLNWPYMGVGLRPLNELYGRVLSRHFPLLASPVNTLLDAAATAPVRRARSNPSLRLCVVAEYQGNTSPGQLLLDVLPRIDRRRFDIIFFHPPGLDTPFSAAMEAVANVSVALPNSNILMARGLILEQECDVLLYLAIGMASSTYYLSHSRLAKVQIQFGHGHPVSGASGGIDYFVSSDLFQFEANRPLIEPYELDGKAVISDEEIVTAAVRNSLHPVTNGVQSYAEQMVRFDTLTASHTPTRPPSFPDWFSFVRNDDLSALELQRWRGTEFGISYLGEWNYYACLQYTKKLHPSFDAVLAGIIRADPRARILVLDGVKRHIPRLKMVLTMEEISARFVFVERQQRERLMLLLSVCKVMLGTFPWGEGVTTFEAFAIGVPVVILPNNVTVEHLTLGQIRMLGLENALLASSVGDYVEKAVRIGSDKIWRDGVVSRIEENIESLVGDKAAAEVIREWENFYERSVLSSL